MTDKERKVRKKRRRIKSEEEEDNGGSFLESRLAGLAIGLGIGLGVGLACLFFANLIHIVLTGIVGAGDFVRSARVMSAITTILLGALEGALVGLLCGRCKEHALLAGGVGLVVGAVVGIIAPLDAFAITIAGIRSGVYPVPWAGLAIGSLSGLVSGYFRP